MAITRHEGFMILHVFRFVTSPYSLHSSCRFYMQSLVVYSLIVRSFIYMEIYLDADLARLIPTTVYVH